MGGARAQIILLRDVFVLCRANILYGVLFPKSIEYNFSYFCSKPVIKDVSVYANFLSLIISVFLISCSYKYVLRNKN